MTETTSTPPASARLLLLDGHSLAFRAFYALPKESFSTSAGQHTNAVYGFLRMLGDLLAEEQPTHLAVAFDVSRDTFRREVYPEYKAQRTKSPEEFTGQVDLIRSALQALGVVTLAQAGVEADDIIATLATRASEAGMETRICTGDRDSLQLVTDAVTVLYPIKGVREIIRFTPAAVEEKYGLTPRQYADFAALRGDPSDNLPGIPRVGEKTATKWITGYGSLDGLVEHADEVRGMAGENLRSNLAQVLLNRRLTELRRDIDLEVGPVDLARTPGDREALAHVFDDLEFGPDIRRRLYERLFPDTTTDAVPGAAATEATPVAQLGPDELEAWLAAHAAAGGPRCAVDVDGAGPVGRAEATAITIAAADGACVFVELTELTPADEGALATWLADPAVATVVHGLKYTLHGLWPRGLDLTGVDVDTSIAAYLVRPGQRSYELPDLALRHLGRELEGAAATEPAQLTLIDGLDGSSAGGDAAASRRRARAGAERARAVAALADALDREMAAISAADLLRDMELPLVPVLAAMERCGIAADRAEFDDLRSKFTARVTGAEDDAATAIGGERVNLASPKQLQVVLFETLGMPKTKRTKTGYTTDAKALEDLFAKTSHPFLAALLAHREATKMRSAVDGLIAAVGEDGRIHTTFHQTVAATGRLSSADPNLQNIPVRTDDGRRIRRGFVVGRGFASILTADYSQIEMRVMAHLSGDAGLIEAFRTGEDLHDYVGSKAFGVPIDEVTPELRRRVKAMSYGLAYGLSSYGLGQQLGIGAAEAQEQMDAYFARFGGVRDYLHAVVENARRVGYTETMFGRRRYLPDLNADNRLRRENAERAALNAPIQGSAADIIKVAMLDVERKLRERGLRSRLLLQVHDELVLEVAHGEREEVTDLVRDCMHGAVSLEVPLEVSVGHGLSWDEAAH